MKKRFLILILLIQIFFRALSQQVDTSFIYRLNYRIEKSGYSNPVVMTDSCRYSIRLSDKIGYEKGKLTALGSMANLFHVTGDYANGLRYSLEALKIAEKYNDPSSIGRCYNGMGLNYMQLGENRQALKCYYKSLEYYKKLNSPTAEGISYNNIANSYLALHSLDTALHYYLRSLELRSSIDDKYGVGSIYNDMSNVYIERNKLNTADSLLQLSLAIMYEVNDNEMQAIAMSNIGNVNYLKGNYRGSLKWLRSSLKIALEIHQIGLTIENYRLLHAVNSKLNDYDEAYKYLLAYMAVKDSLKNDERIREFTKLEQQNKFEKIQLADSIRNEQEKKIMQVSSESKLQQQRFFLYGAGIVLVFISALAFSLLRSNRRRRRDNEIITRQKREVENQKNVIEEKQKEILDSIHYARRIQNSLLPTEKYIERNMPKTKN